MPSGFDESLATLAVLAGGAGTRMGHPKDRLEIAGRPILEYLLQHMGWPGPTCLVAAPGRPPGPGAAGFDRVVEDRVERQGPLEGVRTALSEAGTDIVFVVAVDMPAIRRHHLQWLGRKLTEAPDAAAVMCQRVPNSFIEPLPSVWRRHALRFIEQQRSEGRYALHDFATTAHCLVIPAPFEWGEDVWLNLNRPDDLTSPGAAFL